MTKVLATREEIREWTAARGGNPMLMEVPDGTGSRTILQLTFGQHALNSDGNEGPDHITGYELVDWDEWFQALDDNKLQLMVSDDLGDGTDTDYQFVPAD